ncbi:hypothetical protein A1O7_06628 [Cladophialophora yegresii CBS 114405]|uniref:Uncharacterized protein n=1 Tax=Cladophialophora yegresii CBS 114405 TaxID=1182544 RepID=W9W3T2_9EURO|nr:uncharacterized protein A1O7_06628 [Cladophialophora yegresii CBS 114405]EXJ59196.1 hypothetical protein A1O7_06628 [Cladophialophora yegresii CBS 114405]
MFPDKDRHNGTGPTSHHPQNNLHFGPPQVYGHFAFLPSDPSRHGLIHAFTGQVTTTVHGVETILPTRDYLKHTPQDRHNIIHPPGLVMESGYHNAKPMDPPPNAPPPPPPIDIKTGKPLSVAGGASASDVGPIHIPRRHRLCLRLRLHRSIRHIICHHHLPILRISVAVAMSSNAESVSIVIDSFARQ